MILELSVIHRLQHKVEEVWLRVDAVLILWPGAPGVDAAEALLDEVNIDPSLAVGAVVLVSERLKFE